MCHLLGIVADAPTTFLRCLREAPRSMSRLSREHSDGWGVALLTTGSAWRLHKSAKCAGDDAAFERIAASENGDVLLAHVRQQTVGRVCVTNSHPFRRGHWVFAHNGTIEDLDFLREKTSSPRSREIEGDTDSELLFAYLLSCLDASLAVAGDAVEVTDTALKTALGDVVLRTSSGSFNFLLSNGRLLYAYRRGRPLFILQRRRLTGTVPPTHTAILVASEPLTDEPWQPVANGSLIRVSKEPTFAWRWISGGLEVASTEGSMPELPFTD